MLGRATAALEAAPRSWVQRVWGIPDIHARQKWAAVWPRLAILPDAGLRVIDAGCGAGRWALELGARRPKWTIIGVDRDEEAIASAERARAALSLTNVQFVAADFRALAVDPACVVISIASAHYLASAGEGPQLFRTFAAWLKPGGLLYMLAPRSDKHSPFTQALPHPRWHDVFSATQLEALCQAAGFQVRTLSGCIGPAAILAKQLAWGAGGRAGVRAAAYPVEWAMTLLDSHGGARRGRHTLMWLLVAQAEQSSVR